MDAVGTAFDTVVPTFLLIRIGAIAHQALPSLPLETLGRLAVQS